MYLETKDQYESSLQRKTFRTIAFDSGSISADQPEYSLTVRQQPQKARLCSFKEKVDRRPLDPPPIVQLHQTGSINFNNYRDSSNFFLIATLIDPHSFSDIHVVNGHKTTAGIVAQSLHKLRDTENREGAFFIFSDISVRLEGIFRLKFTLFQIKGLEVQRVSAVISEMFQVYSPKSFPGMSESTEITRLFSEQGVRIRIRKEARIASVPSLKRQRESNEHRIHEQDVPIEKDKKYGECNSNHHSSSYINARSDEEGYKGRSCKTNRAGIIPMQDLLTSDSSSEPIPVPSDSLYPRQISLLQRTLPLPLPTASYSHRSGSNSAQNNTNLLPNLAQALSRNYQ